MEKRKWVLIVSAVLASLMTAALPASAEWFADLHVGAAFTERADVKTKTFVLGTFEDPMCGTFCDIVPFQDQVAIKNGKRFKTSALIGGRVGYWVETAPYVGLALDASHFQPDIRSQTFRHTVTDPNGNTFTFPARLGDVDLSVTAVSLDLMLRAPLFANEQFPKGRLQPYLAVGPTMFIATATTKPATFLTLSDTAATGTVIRPAIDQVSQSDTDASVGWKAGAGVAWQFHRNIALLGEYRFQRFSPEWEFSDSLVGKTTLKTEIGTHHVLVGISFRF